MKENKENLKKRKKVGASHINHNISFKNKVDVNN